LHYISDFLYITAGLPKMNDNGWMRNGQSVPVHLIAGFISFVLKLEKGCYLYQFGRYAWTHLILLFVFIPSSFFVSNIFDGIIWFLLPCSLVIANDIFAYLSGKSAHWPPASMPELLLAVCSLDKTFFSMMLE